MHHGWKGSALCTAREVICRSLKSKLLFVSVLCTVFWVFGTSSRQSSTAYLSDVLALSKHNRGRAIGLAVNAHGSPAIGVAMNFDCGGCRTVK